MSHADFDEFSSLPRVPFRHPYEYVEQCTPYSDDYNHGLLPYELLFPDDQIQIYNINNGSSYNHWDSPLHHEQDLNQSPLYYRQPDPFNEDSVEFPFHCPQQHTIQDTATNARLPSFLNTFAEKFTHQSTHTYIEPRKEPTRRGRPPTYHKNGYNFHDNDSGVETDEDRRSPNSPSVMRCRKGAKNILLWKFLLEELRKPGAQHIQWVAERDGVFKFVDTAETSKLWGMKKKKEDMNFEKLSRGIRHYYRDGLMSRVDGTRLVYQFNWSRVPKAYRWDRNLPRNR